MSKKKRRIPARAINSPLHVSRDEFMRIEKRAAQGDEYAQERKAAITSRWVHEFFDNIGRR